MNFAEWAYVTALAIYGYGTYGALAVGLIGARFIPGALLGPLLVGAVAHHRPTLVLRMLSLGRCVVVAGAAAAVIAHAPLAVPVAIIWLDAVLAAPYRPVQSAILPALAGTPRELSAVAGSVPASKALAQAAGALAGSAALALVSPQTIVIAAAAALLCIAALVAPVRAEAPLPEVPPPASDSASRRSRYLSVRSGFELIARRARPLLLLGGARALTRGVWIALAVVASIRLLHLGNTGVGVLMAAAGVGAAAAVPLSLRFAGRERLAGPASLMFAFAGIPITLVGVIAKPVPAVAIVVVWGAAFALADSISNSLIHRVVEYRLLAPSVAAIESSKLLLEGIGALAAPGLLALLGIRDALIVAGAPLPLLVLISRRGLLAIDGHAATRGRPLAALRRAPSFRGLTMLSLENITARLQRATAAAGSAIIRQGDLGDRFYLIESGRVEVTVDGFRVSILGPGDSFGEKALLRATKRSATVTSLEPTDLWYLDGPDFIAAATGTEGPVAHRVQPSTRSLEDVLAAVPLFAAIDPRRLAPLGQLSSAPAGEEILRQGESGDSFHVLVEGEASVTIDGESVGTLKGGDSFGEIALLHSVPRTATVTTIAKSTLWSLDRDRFLATLGEAALLDGAPRETALAGAGLLV